MENGITYFLISFFFTFYYFYFSPSIPLFPNLFRTFYHLWKTARRCYPSPNFISSLAPLWLSLLHVRKFSFCSFFLISFFSSLFFLSLSFSYLIFFFHPFEQKAEENFLIFEGNFDALSSR